MHWNGFRETVPNLLSFLVLCGVVQAQGLGANQQTAVIIGCAIGGSILLIVITVLLVLCCKSTKKEKELKKKKGQYQQFHDPFVTKTYNHAVNRVPNGHANGHANRLAAPKLERSRSDVQGSSTNYVMPEWRQRQDGRGDAGSQLNGVRDSGSDISVPTGIWTSNPTLTRGLPPGQVAMSSGGPIVPNGRSHQRYGSDPVLNANPATIDPKVWDRPKAQKKPQPKQGVKKDAPKRSPSKRDSGVKTKEDRKELLQSTARESTPGRDSQMVARAYSNPAFKQEAPVSPTKAPGQDGPFVAKVFSDYQLPRDFLPENTSNAKQNTQVAKAIGGNPKENMNRRSGDSSQNGVFVTKTNIRPNSFDSNGEPKYMYPQDAYRTTQSDWVLLNKTNKQVSRTQSNMEKARPPGVVPVAKGKKPQRSASQLVGKYDPGLDGRGPRDNSQMTNIGGSDLNVAGNGIFVQYQPAGVHEQNKKNKKLVKEKEAKRKSKSSPRDEKLKAQKSGKVDKTKNAKGLAVDIEAARSNTSQLPNQPLPEAPIHNINRPASNNPNIDQQLGDPNVDDAGDSSRRISESSSILVSPEPVVAAAEPSTDSHGEPLADSSKPADIYAVPLKVVSRPSSQVVTDSGKTPLSPNPPPVPPVTELREETEKSRPPSISSRRRLKSTTSDGDGLSTGRRVTSAFEFLDTYSNKDDQEDRMSVVTTATGREGKNVIGDAFQFLEDFDDNASFDGELEKF